MRRLTENDLKSILGTTVGGYLIEKARVKRGEFCDSDHYGVVLGKSSDGRYATWQYHLDEDESVNAYWGHYFMENYDGAMRDYESRDMGVLK